MIEQRRVLNAIHQGGSGSGVSYYGAANTCGRRAILDREYPRISDLSDPRDNAATVGTLFHLFAEAYYTNTPLEGAVEINQLSGTSNWAEAQRLFKEHRSRFPKESGGMGKVIACEMDLPVRGPDGEPVSLDNPFGVEKFTARIDMVVEHTEDSIKVFEKERGLVLPEPGIYLVDHKTKGRMDPHMEYGWKMGYQTSAYMMYYEYLFGVRPKGMIMNVIIRHKKLTDASFVAYLIPYPDEDQQQATKWFMQRGEQNVKIGAPNPGACIGQYGACVHLTSGTCNRYK